MKTYTVTLNNIDIEITQDDDGKFIKPTLVTSLESMATAQLLNQLMNHVY